MYQTTGTHGIAIDGTTILEAKVFLYHNENLDSFLSLTYWCAVFRIMEVLLRHGADVDTQNDSGKTA